MEADGSMSESCPLIGFVVRSAGLWIISQLWRYLINFRENARDIVTC
jgi:hypothetical protein